MDHEPDRERVRRVFQAASSNQQAVELVKARQRMLRVHERRFDAEHSKLREALDIAKAHKEFIERALAEEPDADKESIKRMLAKEADAELRAARARDAEQLKRVIEEKKPKTSAAYEKLIQQEEERWGKDAADKMRSEIEARIKRATSILERRSQTRRIVD